MAPPPLRRTQEHPPAPRLSSSRASLLRVLGQVHLDGGPGRSPHLVLRQPKKLAFLVYLAMNPDGVSRGRLTSLFWPESDDGLARASLRQYLSQLRGALGPGIVTRTGAYAVGLDAKWITTDAVAFQALLDRGVLEEALDLYRGSFLDGFVLGRLDEFDDWAATVRRGLESRAAAAAWTLALRAQREGDVTQAAFWGKRSLGLSPLEESRVRDLMQLLDLVGDRGGALRAYRGLEEWLAREFEATPSAETRAIYRRMFERKPEVAAPDASFESRRVRSDRRSGSERRLPHAAFREPERRSGVDRRSLGERRTGSDRRRPVGSRPRQR